MKTIKYCTLMFCVFILSCHSKQEEIRNDNAKNRKEYINSANQDGLKELIISDSLRKYVVYAVNKINKFKDWPYPFYCIIFEKDTINISIATARSVHFDVDNDYHNDANQCIGYYRYRNSIFQIFDNIDLSKKQRIYSTSCLRQLSNNLLDSLAAVNTNRIGRQINALTLKKTDTGYKIVADDLDNHW